jgi:hypothetical protein
MNHHLLIANGTIDGGREIFRDGRRAGAFPGKVLRSS